MSRWNMRLGVRTQKLSNLLQIRISNLDMMTVNLIRSQMLPTKIYPRAVNPTVLEQTSSLLKDMGPLDNIAGFMQSQKDMYNSLGHIKHKIVLVHGPFGTGKTRAIIKVIVKYLSNPQKKQQVLYVTRSNVGVDDAALRCQKECEEYGVDKLIISTHRRKGERAKFVKIKRRPYR